MFRLDIIKMHNVIHGREGCFMMVKGYQKKNVYDAIQERFHYLFHEFENIYVSFSGGKGRWMKP